MLRSLAVKCSYFSFQYSNRRIFIIFFFATGCNLSLLFLDTTLIVLYFIYFVCGHSYSWLDVLSIVPNFTNHNFAVVNKRLFVLVWGNKRFVDALVFHSKFFKVVVANYLFQKCLEVSLYIFEGILVKRQLFQTFKFGGFIVHGFDVELRVIFAVININHT